MKHIAIPSHFEKLARLGYASRGILYLVIGGLAMLAAFGEGGKTAGSRGALKTIMNQPLGDVLLWVLVLGLFGYAAWRLVQAITDTDDHGTDAKGIAVRGGLLVSAVTHILLAIWAISLLLGGGSGGGGGSSDWTSAVYGTGWGQFIIGAIGVAVIGAGLAHIYKGWTAGFEKYVALPPDHRSWAKPLCQFGLIARGVVWLIIGWFIINSALQASRGEIAGVGEALQALQSASYGPWLLAVVAAGLFAFGIYSILEARYRRVDA